MTQVGAGSYRSMRRIMFVTSLRTDYVWLSVLASSTARAVAQSIFASTRSTRSTFLSVPVFNPSANSASMWQMDPFGVGYDLLGGYRPIYAGARQSVGHEIIPTRADGNGYVYRPVYEASPGYHYTRGGA